MKIEVPFIDQCLEIDLPPGNLLFDASPHSSPPVTDFERTIVSALQNPVGTRPLKDLIPPGGQIVLICDDNTRPTPVHRIIPILLNFFNQAGVPDAHLEIVIASGTHRAMTQDELAEKYGPEVMERVRVYPHDYLKPEELINFGVTRRGTPVWVNRRVAEAGFRVAVGNIVPHHPAGWSGGAKAVLPGVAGKETVARMHLLGSQHPALGEIDTEMRREMEDFAAAIGLDFILNVVLNRQEELVGAMAGHFVAAHRAGVALSKQVYGVAIPALADLTISSTAPLDIDFFQGDKGITSAERATRRGGEILLVSGCLEGISPAHPELSDYVGKLTNEQIWKLIEQRQMLDPLTAAEAIVINDILAKMHISIVSRGLSPDLCRAMGMLPIDPRAIGGYLNRRIQANPDLKVGILRKSADILPFLEK